MAWLLTDLKKRAQETLAQIDASFQENQKSPEVKEGEEAVNAEEVPLENPAPGKEANSEEGSFASKLQFAGNKLFSYAKESTVMAGKGLEAVKSAVEKHTIIGDLNAEQAAFEKQVKETQPKEITAPWIGSLDEALAKKKILALSLNTGNFLRDSAGDTEFSPEEQQAMAALLLEADPNLQTVRFQLVPKQLTETKFWSNYFYRVSLIRQSLRNATSTPEQEVGDEQVVGMELDTTQEAETSHAEDPKTESTQNASDSERTETTQAESPTKAPLSEEEWERELLADITDYDIIENTGKSEQEWEAEIQDLLNSEDA